MKTITTIVVAAPLIALCGFGIGWNLHAPSIPDSTFVTTNGTVAVVIGGHRKDIAYDATNMVVRTKRGARITTEFKP